METGMTIDLRREATEFRAWLEQKVSAAREAMAQEPPPGLIGNIVYRGPAYDVRSRRRENHLPGPIGGIVALYCYDQNGWVGLDFDTREEFALDGDISAAAWADLQKKPAWQSFAETEGTDLMTFTEANGTDTSVPANEMTDEFLSSHLGGMIAGVLVAAWEDNVFSSLRLRPGCVLSVNDFYGNWGWEAKEVAGKLVTT
jgi:hypothetical protein